LKGIKKLAAASFSLASAVTSACAASNSFLFALNWALQYGKKTFCNQKISTLKFFEFGKKVFFYPTVPFFSLIKIVGVQSRTECRPWNV
jgi:hypothetical protein